MAFKIVVCVKQVPDTNEIKIDPVKKTLIREGVPSILNPDDANALEAALQIKDELPETEVTVISMGPPQAKAMLTECMAMGADRAVLLSDRALGGSDTWATSNALAAGIQKLGGCDLIFAGQQAIDGDTAQVGPQIAEKLALPQVTYVSKIETVGSTAGESDTMTVVRALEDGYERIKVQIPCLITAIKALNEPRYMSIRGIFDALQKDVTVWQAADLGVDATEVGLDASPTNVYRSFTPVVKGRGQQITGDTDRELAVNLLQALKSKQIV
ncbi:electron transfer flavoprotein subunit beta/FixA family protein [Fusibacter paucivorans]|uniref:Electron transfer flavoprotein small subunit n=1 Tax=Fusibacter paucivorans TaxID=76009 RepID=A0ABS5PPX1_9FIRM|nr:electron transfer flavoprotein subunit beta/FixA family protein [Fusibacter paucivorans]MBS7526444.1 electron transfer flavoprotein subunit beta/FixA family protein [Fusibacter paucivorans]